jgi:broad specificity phosphatase PhoE
MVAIWRKCRMGSLVLVRHAQASFFSADYDQLSGKGQEQARRLGDYWASHEVGFDEVLTGPRARHRATAELVGERFERAGVAFPKMSVREALDEHAVDQLLRERDVMNGLCREHPHLVALVENYASARRPNEQQTGFQKLFEAVVRLWIQGACTIRGFAAWPEYRDRVWALLSGLAGDAPRGRRIALFTSVGPISCALMWALKCTELVGLEVGWRLRNASLTEIVFSSDRATLDSFNALPHLAEPELWTFR